LYTPGIKHNFRPGFWVRGGSRVFARISSRTLGRYVVVTNPAPPRCGPTNFNGFLWLSRPPPAKSRDSGTGHLGHQNAAPTPHSRHPTRPGSCAAETTALGPTGAHLGGAPRWRRPGPRRPEPRTPLCRNAQGPSKGPPERQAAPHAIYAAPGLPSYEK
jgi:hypothetical protein